METNAATALTQGMFEELKTNPEVGRSGEAECLAECLAIEHMVSSRTSALGQKQPVRDGLA